MSSRTSILISLIVAVGLIFGTLALPRGSKGPDGAPSVTNVSVVDGTQVITIDAKGGYSPRITSAKADLPTIIKMNTRGTFDCSSALVIPDIGYRANLPPTGETVIEVPPQKAGTTLQGLCSMGMYNFAIRFE